MRQIARGDPGADLPARYLFVLVAAAHATTPRAVRGWPADDFADAANMLPLTLLWSGANGE